MILPGPLRFCYQQLASSQFGLNRNSIISCKIHSGFLILFIITWLATTTIVNLDQSSTSSWVKYSAKSLPFPLIFGNNIGQVALFTVLHNDVNGGFRSVNDSVIVSYNIVMLKLSQQVDFRHKHLFLSFTHLSVIQLFPNQILKRNKGNVDCSAIESVMAYTPACSN